MDLTVFFPLRGRYYKSIDEMPIYNWFRLQETNDIKFVMKCKKALSKKQFAEIEKAVKDMQAEYIDVFGINDQYKNYLELIRSIRILEIERAVTGDKIKTTFIEIKKVELNNLLKQMQGGQINTVTVHAEKYMGFKLNLKELSVREFYTIIEEMKREHKTQPKEQAS